MKRKQEKGVKAMTVKRMAKSMFFIFLVSCVSFFILQILDIIGGDKYTYYVGGAVYPCLYSIVDRATMKWRRK
jgi:hypothetical protein